MGYSHYWELSREFTDDEWTALQGVARTLHADVDEGRIAIHGDHESFVVTRLEYSEQFYGDGLSWNCCKTRKKDYDVDVTAVLCYLDTLPHVAVSSDGEPADWRAGQQRASLALGCMLPIPTKVRQYDEDEDFNTPAAPTRHRDSDDE